MMEKNLLANLFDRFVSALPTEQNKEREFHLKSAGESLDRMIDRLRCNPASYYESPFEFSKEFRSKLYQAGIDELSDKPYKMLGLSGPGDIALLEHGPNYRFYGYRLMCAKSAVEGESDPLGLLRYYGDSLKLNVCVKDVTKSLVGIAKPSESGLTRFLMKADSLPESMQARYETALDIYRPLRNESITKDELGSIINNAIILANSAYAEVQAVITKRKKFSADNQAEIFPFNVTYS